MIAAREAPERDTKSLVNDHSISREDKISKIVNEAQIDLQSSQPPMRARAMVSLGKLARGYLSEEMYQHPRPKIMELGSKAEEPSASILTNQILRLATTALADDESYVYLAAVQTLVALGETLSPETIPDMATAVATGKMDLLANDSEPLLELSNEQRCKMADSLTFLIRRSAKRGQLVPSLINTMLFSKNGRISDNSSEEAKDEMSNILQQTHSYFRNTRSEDEDTDGETLEDQRAEMDIRLRTGGPVFDVEEADAVRAARVSVVSELVSTCDPSSIAPYGRMLAEMCISALRLENSRMVTRASALLARELYGAVLREYEMLQQQSSLAFENKQKSLAMSFFGTREDLLQVLLQEHASLVDDKTESSSLWKDPATSARCVEALGLRDQLEQAGLIAVTRLAIAANEEDTTPKMLQVVNQSSSNKARITEVVDREEG
jgi:hypothetical protein